MTFLCRILGHCFIDRAKGWNEPPILVCQACGKVVRVERIIREMDSGPESEGGGG